MPDTRQSGRTVWVGALVIAAAVVCAYANSLSAAFVFDDVPGIVLNRTIRDLADVRAVFSPPPEAAGAGGRPFVNFTLALNYAIGGLDPRGYHLANLVIHLLAALTLFGVLRRTFVRPPPAVHGATSATPVALTATLLWALHPLLTESVTFVIQRNESLVGLFYLLTLYCFVRGATEPGSHQRRWYVAMVAACVLGVLSKELMATAPIAVLLYDRTFVSGSFRAAWQRHRRWYLALVATWLLLAVLVLGAAQRGGTVGFGLGVTPWHYLLTQCQAIVHYLRLAFWPDALVIDYGTDVVTSPLDVLPQALLLLGLLGATLWALCRRRAEGFAGAWFFLILAPSSSIVPLTTQTMAEHRMYLPLLAIVVPTVVVLFRVAGRPALATLCAVALLCGWLTVLRNRDYASEITILRDSIARHPANYRAHYDLGTALSAAGQPAEAIAAFREAVRLAPDKADPHNNLANALVRVGRMAEAVAEFEATIRLDPAAYDAHTNLANVLDQVGRKQEALAHYDAALRIKADLPAAHSGRGNVLDSLGRSQEAVLAYREALRIDPDNVQAHFNLGNTYLHAGRLHEAIASYTAALRLAPDFAGARNNLRIARQRAGLGD